MEYNTRKIFQLEVLRSSPRPRVVIAGSQRVPQEVELPALQRALLRGNFIEWLGSGLHAPPVRKSLKLPKYVGQAVYFGITFRQFRWIVDTRLYISDTQVKQGCTGTQAMPD